METLNQSKTQCEPVSLLKLKVEYLNVSIDHKTEKPQFEHDCERCMFLGNYSDKLMKEHFSALIKLITDF